MTQAQTMLELGACPFCSGAGSVQKMDRSEEYWGSCSVCEASTGVFGSPESAIAQWNTRATTAAAQPVAFDTAAVVRKCSEIADRHSYAASQAILSELPPSSFATPSPLPAPGEKRSCHDHPIKRCTKENCCNAPGEVAGGGEPDPKAKEGWGTNDLFSYIPSIVENAMLTMWNYICDDTKCHPLDIEHGKGKYLIFKPGHWAKFTGEMVERNIRDLFKPATISPGGGAVEALKFVLNELSYISKKHGYVSTETAIIRVNEALSALPPAQADGDGQ